MTRLLVLFVTAFVDMVGLTMIIPLLPFYATELGASATVVGLLVSAFAVVRHMGASAPPLLDQPRSVARTPGSTASAATRPSARSASETSR